MLQLKSVGPKLVPFFKTLTIYFVLFADGSRVESPLYCVIKCLPVISLMFFVLLHGMSFSEYYSYSRKVTIFLDISVIPVQLQHAVHGIGSALTHIIITIIVAYCCTPPWQPVVVQNANDVVPACLKIMSHMGLTMPAQFLLPAI